ncbi:unnamed protein product [Debaryomyces fabryi]|nr:unnamed protein product [Debaryomyces fabryi]
MKHKAVDQSTDITIPASRTVAEAQTISVSVDPYEESPAYQSHQTLIKNKSANTPYPAGHDNTPSHQIFNILLLPLYKSPIGHIHINDR